MPNTDVSLHEYHCPKASSSCTLAESLPMIYRKHQKSLPISAKLELSNSLIMRAQMVAPPARF